MSAPVLCFAPDNALSALRGLFDPAAPSGDTTETL